MEAARGGLGDLMFMVVKVGGRGHFFGLERGASKHVIV